MCLPHVGMVHGATRERIIYQYFCLQERTKDDSDHPRHPYSLARDQLSMICTWVT